MSLQITVTVFLAFSAPIPANAEGRENWLPEVAIFASLLEKYETFQISYRAQARSNTTWQSQVNFM